MKNFIKSLFKSIASNEYVEEWNKKHQRRNSWLARRFDTKNFTGLPLTATLLVGLYILALLLGVTEDFIKSEMIVALDLRLAHLMLLFRDIEWLKVSYWFTLLGTSWVIGSVILVISILFLIKNQYKKIVVFWLTIGGSSATTMIAKMAFHRARPDLSAIAESSFSFPSGHATISAAFFGIIVYLLWPHLSSWTKKILAMIAAALLMIAVSFSRLYLGVHYLSDVTSGLLIGLLWVVIGISIGEWLRHKNELWNFKFHNEKKISTKNVLAVFIVSLVIITGAGLATMPKFQLPSEVAVADVTVQNPLDIFSDNKLPRNTETILGVFQEPISLIITAPSDEDFISQMKTAGWELADTIRPSTIFQLATNAARNKPYATAPMTPSFWNSRVHNFGFEQATEKNTARQRHHARFWKTNFVTSNGNRIYLGTSSLDTGVKWGITHTIDPYIDGERDLLKSSLETSNSIINSNLVAFSKPSLGKNFTGDQFFSDGKAWVIELK